jgi:predicted DNA-binding protein
MGKMREGTQVISVVLSDAQVRLIDELSNRMGQTRSRMVALLVEAGLEDNEMIIRFVTTPAMKKLAKLVFADARKDSKIQKMLAEGAGD